MGVAALSNVRFGCLNPYKAAWLLTGRFNLAPSAAVYEGDHGHLKVGEATTKDPLRSGTSSGCAAEVA